MKSQARSPKRLKSLPIGLTSQARNEGVKTDGHRKVGQFSALLGGSKSG